MELDNRNSQYYQEDEPIDITEILFTILSHRGVILASVITCTLIGITYNYYHNYTFKTNATLLVSKDQSDPSSFINNNEYQYLYDNKNAPIDHVAVFKSTIILNKVADDLDLNYRYYRKNLWKDNELIIKESLPFEIYFKQNISDNKCIISFKNKSVSIQINDKTFSFSINENEFENSIFAYKPKFLNYESQDTFIINKLEKSQVIKELKSNYYVQGIDKSKTNTYSLSYAGPNKKLNSIILNSIINEIIENNVREKKSVYKQATNFLDFRISNVKKQIDSLNSLISNFKISQGVYLPINQTNSALDNINEIEQKIFYNSLQHELSVKLLKEAEKQKSFQFLPNDIGIENENINTMVTQFNQVIIEKNNLFGEAPEKNPLVIQSQNQLNDLKSNILNSLNIYIDKLRMTSNRYNDYKRNSNSVVGVIPIREAKLGNLEKDLLRLNDLYSFLSQKNEEALINLSSLKSNIKLINEVDYVLESKNKKSQTLALILAAGLFLPVGFSYGVYYIRTYFVSVKYLKSILIDINYLGILKFNKGEISSKIKSLNNELLNRINHNMNSLLPKSNKGKTIMITSCIKNEGKTYTAFNLSTFLASTGKKVLLLGADLGNPDLSKLYNEKSKNIKGLTNIINDQNNNFKELFEEYKINNDHLDTLFVGTKLQNKNSVFDSQTFDDLISYLKEKYDYIIFDTAPVLYMVDSLKLLEKLDSVVHVFRRNYSSKKLVNELLEYKEKYELKNVGYIIVDDSKSDKFIDKYGYKYGYGYGYGRYHVK